MTGKEYLSRYYQAVKDIAYIERELERLKDSAADIKATDYGKVVVDGTKNTDTIGSLVARIEEKAQALKMAKIKARAIMLDIEDTLDGIEKAEVRQVLCQRYIDLLKWDEIARETAYSITHVKRLHAQGLKDLEAKR